MVYKVGWCRMGIRFGCIFGIALRWGSRGRVFRFVCVFIFRRRKFSFELFCFKIFIGFLLFYKLDFSFRVRICMGWF